MHTTPFDQLCLRFQSFPLRSLLLFRIAWIQRGPLLFRDLRAQQTENAVLLLDFITNEYIHPSLWSLQLTEGFFFLEPFLKAFVKELA